MAECDLGDRTPPGKNCSLGQTPCQSACLALSCPLFTALGPGLMATAVPKLVTRGESGSLLDREPRSTHGGQEELPRGIREHPWWKGR